MWPSGTRTEEVRPEGVTKQRQVDPTHLPSLGWAFCLCRGPWAHRSSSRLRSSIGIGHLIPRIPTAGYDPTHGRGPESDSVVIKGRRNASAHSSPLSSPFLRSFLQDLHWFVERPLSAFFSGPGVIPTFSSVPSSATRLLSLVRATSRLLLATSLLSLCYTR